MKRILLLIAFLLAVVGNVFAVATTDQITATMGDQNSSGQYRVQTQFDGTNGYLRFSSDTGIFLPYLNYTSVGTTNITLTAAQSGITITDSGGTQGPTGVGFCRKFVLPTASPGMQFSFAAGSKCTITVDTADTNDTIMYSISGTGLDAGDSIKSTGQAGDSVTLFSTVANQWQVKAMKSTWTDNGTN